MKHLQNLGRGHYLRGMSILCLNFNKGEVVYGNDQHLERHEGSPILHEPGESPNLGFSEQLSAQGMTTLSVVTTGPLWAGMNISRVWISLYYSQEITWVVFPHEARVELTGSCALKMHPADGDCCLTVWAAQEAQPGMGLILSGHTA